MEEEETSVENQQRKSRRRSGNELGDGSRVSSKPRKRNNGKE